MGSVDAMDAGTGRLLRVRPWLSGMKDSSGERTGRLTTASAALRSNVGYRGMLENGRVGTVLRREQPP
jgi:hypothetical protein